MWIKIRNLFRRILSLFLISEDKTAVFPEAEPKLIGDESYEFDHAQPVISIVGPSEKREQRNIFEDESSALLEGQIESQEKVITIDLGDSDSPKESGVSKNSGPPLSKEGIKPDNIEPSEKEEVFDIETSQIEEEIRVIENHIFDEPVDALEPLDSDSELTHYIRQFSNLITNRGPNWSAKTKGQAPHKPLLLLSILDLFARGQITKNLIEISPDLIESFSTYWNIVVSERSGQIVLPFFHLKSSDFWHLLALPGQEAALQISRRMDSLSSLQKMVYGAKLDENLFELLQIQEKRDELRAVLIRTYFDSDLHKILHEQGRLTEEAESYSQQSLEPAHEDIVIKVPGRKNEDESLALLEDQIELQEKGKTSSLEARDSPKESDVSKNCGRTLSKEGIKSDSIEPSESEEIFDVDSSQFEEEITLVENHISNEPMDVLDALDSKGNLAHYIQQFSNLINSWGSFWSVKTKGQAPHKPVLLLSILDLFARGQITKNLIEISPELIELFTTYWNIVIPERSGQIALPFFHLKSSNFWHLIALPGQEAVLEGSKRIRSLSSLQKIVLGAKLDEKLFKLFQIQEKPR